MTGEHEPVQPVAEENVVEPKSGENAEIHAGEGENDAASLRASATTEEGNVGKKSPTFFKKSRQALNNKINSALSIFNRKKKPVQTTNSADTLTETTKEMTGEHEPVQPVAEENVVEPKSGENAEIHAGEGENDAASLRASATTEEGNVGKKSPTFFKKSRQALNNKINSALSIFNRKTKPLPTTNSADSRPPLAKGENDATNTNVISDATTTEVTGKQDPLHAITEKDNVVADGNAANIERDNVVVSGKPGRSIQKMMKKAKLALVQKMINGKKYAKKLLKQRKSGANDKVLAGEGANDVANAAQGGESDISRLVSENGDDAGGAGIDDPVLMVTKAQRERDIVKLTESVQKLIGHQKLKTALENGRYMHPKTDEGKVHEFSNRIEEGAKKEDQPHDTRTSTTTLVDNADVLTNAGDSVK
ncbi:unnamed protein product [Peronospora farinosa]|uniref:Uncharacterized protein n=1 Tax=Peronospora farinosa TaxID=134698 RepID=A0ABN8CCV5_9STRA|nr:unnamed protein product [Peronospora farinosa]